MLVTLSSAHPLRRTSCVSSTCALKRSTSIEQDFSDRVAQPVVSHAPLLARAGWRSRPRWLDGPRNRLHIFANHEGGEVGGIDGMGVDYDDEDDLQIEEMD